MQKPVVTEETQRNIDILMYRLAEILGFISSGRLKVIGGEIKVSAGYQDVEDELVTGLPIKQYDGTRLFNITLQTLDDNFYTKNREEIDDVAVKDDIKED